MNGPFRNSGPYPGDLRGESYPDRKTWTKDSRTLGRLKPGRDDASQSGPLVCRTVVSTIPVPITYQAAKTSIVLVRPSTKAGRHGQSLSEN